MPGAPVRPLVFLLPGWGTPSERMQPLADALEDAGCDARLWRYDPVGDLGDLVDAFAHVVERQPADRTVHLVGHSLGGVIVSAAAAGPLAGRVTDVIAINTPFRGTWLGYTGSMALARQLRWGATQLTDLRTVLAAHLREDAGPMFHTIAMYGDLGTPPSTAAMAPRGRRLTRRVLPLWGHSVSLVHPRLIREVVAVLTPTDALADTPRASSA